MRQAVVAGLAWALVGSGCRDDRPDERGDRDAAPTGSEPGTEVPTDPTAPLTTGDCGAPPRDPWVRDAVTSIGTVTFTELQVHPPAGAGGEWVELHNPNALDVDLSGWTLTGGISYRFPDGTVLPARGYLVVAADPDALAVAGAAGALGPFDGDLGDQGERVELVSNGLRRIDSVGYALSDPWPVHPDGSGATLAKRRPDAASDRAEHWAGSADLGGTPGRPNTVDDSGSPIGMNEIPAGGAGPFWLELAARSADADLGPDLLLVSSSGGEWTVPGGDLAAGDLLRLDDLDPAPGVGEALFLFDVGRARLLDAVRVEDRPRARPAPGAPWRTPSALTPGRSNEVGTVEDIVINEILYHRDPLREPGGPLVERDEEWLELTNRGVAPRDLGGWQLADAVGFTFPPGTTLAPGAFLVIAEDADAVRAAHPGIEVLGDYEGGLSDRTDRVLLLDGCGNPADEVRYSDDGRWPEAADGGGASLELKHPAADNAAPEAWAASDERRRTAWRTYEYDGVGTSNTPGPDGTWDELVLGLLEAGEVLLDDVSVVENPDTDPVEVIRDGGFDAPERWRWLGNHGRSQIVDDPDDRGNPVLRLVATGPTEHMHNHLETTLSRPIRSVPYRISFRARWVSGSPQLHTRLYFNRAARVTALDTPDLVGTPGARNTARVDALGPTFGALRQSPAVPAPGQPVTFSVDVADPDLVAEVVLWTRLGAETTFDAAPMTEAAPGRWEVTLPGQPRGTLAQLYVEATDGDGATARLPAAGPDARALAVWDEPPVVPAGLPVIRVLMTRTDAASLRAPTEVMSNDLRGATVIDDEQTVFYDVGIRGKGSQHGRPEDARIGYALHFSRAEPYRGTRSAVHLDRSEGVLTGQREALLHQMGALAGLPSAEHTDVAHLVAPPSLPAGPVEVQLDRFGSAMLDAQFPDGADGAVHDYDYVYFPVITADGAPEGRKLPLPDGIMGRGLGATTSDPEDVRWFFVLGNQVAPDDFEAVLRLGSLFALDDDAFLASAPDVLDLDQWLQALAFGALSGTGDNYVGDGSGHNARFYVRPSDGRILLFPHDMDHNFYEYGNAVSSNDAARLTRDPLLHRAYYQHLEALLRRVGTTASLGRWCDQLGRLLPDQDFEGHCAFVDERARYLTEEAPDALLTTYPAVDFAIELPAGPSVVSPSPHLTLRGRGWIDVREIRWEEAGTSLAVRWLDDETWEVDADLAPGPQTVTLVAFDLGGAEVGRDAIDADHAP